MTSAQTHLQERILAEHFHDLFLVVAFRRQTYKFASDDVSITGSHFNGFLSFEPVVALVEVSCESGGSAL